MEGSQQSPCPNRIFDDMGSAFAMGAIGGTLWHGGKGMRNSPKGDRLRGAYNAITLRAPTLGGNFAVWGGLFAVFDCSLSKIRHREDSWNAICAGALTGGTLAARAGGKAMLINAGIGGALLAFIEGISVLMSRQSAESPAQQFAMRQQQIQEEQQRKQTKQLIQQQQQHKNSVKTMNELSNKHGEEFENIPEQHFIPDENQFAFNDAEDFEPL